MLNLRKKPENKFSVTLVDIKFCEFCLINILRKSYESEHRDHTEHNLSLMMLRPMAKKSLHKLLGLESVTGKRYMK